MRKIDLATVLFAVMLFLIAGIYAYFVYEKLGTNLSSQKEYQAPNNFFKPNTPSVHEDVYLLGQRDSTLSQLSKSDKLYLTAIPKGLNVNVPNEFEVAIVSEIFKSVNKPNSLLVFDFTKHKNNLAFIAVKDVDFNSNQGKNVENLYRLFINNKFSVYNAKEISLPQNVRAPQNPDVYYNKLLFNAKTTQVTQKASDWDIFIYSDKTGIKSITKGLYPKWIDKDKFIFLGDDGLYLYDLSLKSKENIWPIKGYTNPIMYFSLSSDKKYIAWTFPHQSKLIVLEFYSKQDGILSEKLILNTVALWPVWRENDYKIAFIGLEDFRSFIRKPNSVKARLSFYDLERQDYINVPVNKYNVSDYIKLDSSKLNLWIK